MDYNRNKSSPNVSQDNAIPLNENYTSNERTPSAFNTVILTICSVIVGFLSSLLCLLICLLIAALVISLFSGSPVLSFVVKLANLNPVSMGFNWIVYSISGVAASYGGLSFTRLVCHRNDTAQLISFLIVGITFVAFSVICAILNIIFGNSVVPNISTFAIGLGFIQARNF